MSLLATKSNNPSLSHSLPVSQEVFQECYGYRFYADSIIVMEGEEKSIIRLMN